MLIAGLVLSLFAQTILAASWQQGQGYRSIELAVGKSGRTGFTRLEASATGVRFTNHLSDTLAAENQIRLVGSGIALGDVDGDGWCDLYVCQLEGPNHLYRNLGGWKFADITAAAGVACDQQWSTGAALADLDGDGDADLLVNALGGGTRCFFNDGAARFTEQTNSGWQRFAGSTSFALADIDNDGDLDVYVANYRTNTIRSTGLNVLNVNGKRVLRPEDRDQYEFTPEGFILEHAEPDVLYLNDGRGKFSAAAWTDGRFLDEDGKPLAAAPKDWSLSALLRDANGDGAPDLYVCNDFWSIDRFWINDGQGRFRALPRLAMRNMSTFSMGVDFADINRDGFDDFIVLDMMSRDHQRRVRQRAMAGQNFNQVGQIEDRPQVERNTLQLNRGDNTYAEIAQLSDLHASEWAWAVAFLDVDLDGFEDVLITTGHGFDTQDSDAENRINAMGPLPSSRIHTKLLLYPRLNLPNLAFRNRGDLTFEDKSAAWGFDQDAVTHGMALGDLDNDGDLDVVVNNLNQSLGLYRNETAQPRVAVRLRGHAPNTSGIGARISFRGGPILQHQEVIAGGRYLSSDFPERVFAAKNVGSNSMLEVRWRDGSHTIVTNVQPNRRYEISQGDAARAVPPTSPTMDPLFVEVPLSHRHSEQSFDDFARQPLLSRRFSQLGPGLAWCDFDGDGWEDLLVGAGAGGKTALLRNQEGRGFVPIDLSVALGRAGDDQTSVLSWPLGGGASTLLVATSNYESGNSNSPSVVRYESWAGGIETKESLPGLESSAGPMVTADIDGDGDLDLFIGGRVVPGRYPEGATSRLYRREPSGFVLATEWKGLGLVSGAIFTDLDEDGFPELVLACEWDSIRLFANQRGALTEGTSAWGLANHKGWWNGVAAGDFDGDGKMDLAASNWGRNHSSQPLVGEGLRIYYADFAGRGTIDGIESYFDRAHRRWVCARDMDALLPALPWLADHYATHKAFSEASLEEVLDTRLAQAKMRSANGFETTIFLNRIRQFAARPLPISAQMAPAFGLAVADFDGDGSEDLFLSQNFFGVEARQSRADAGQGLLLRGDGLGGMKAMNAGESGIAIYGEQRGTACADYDGDGRIDLAVTQNDAGTKLFHNVRGRAGVRVRVQGPEGNPCGIGAILRANRGETWGPAREVHGGGGYWSQDSLVTVMNFRDESRRLLVRFPGGKEEIFSVPAGAKEIVVGAGKGVTLLR